MGVPQLHPGDPPRLKAQCRRIMAFYVQHPGWYTLGELCRATGAISEAGISARLRELTGEGYGWTKTVRMRKFPLREYRLTPPDER